MSAFAARVDSTPFKKVCGSCVPELREHQLQMELQEPISESDERGLFLYWLKCALTFGRNQDTVSEVEFWANPIFHDFATVIIFAAFPIENINNKEANPQLTSQQVAHSDGPYSIA